MIQDLGFMNFNIKDIGQNNNQTEGGICKSRLLGIREIIVFFDMFDYPLTSWEVEKYCDLPSPRLDAVETSLGEMSNYELRTSNIFNDEHASFFREGKTTTADGFYFLLGRESIIETRKKRYNYSMRKLKRAKLIAKIFKIIPWIKMIAVGNIIGSYNLKDDSDIDLFIITEKNRIWLSRFFCVVITKILNLRPTPKNSRDKICLSFFVSEENLNLEKLMLKETKFPSLLRRSGYEGRAGNLVSSSPDVYFIYWLAGLYPIYTNNTWSKFYEANNWLKNYLPNWQAGEFNNKFNAGKPWPKFYRISINFIFGWAEKQSKKIQLKFLAPDLKKLMNQDTRVVINDQVLKLHVLDRREHYRDLYYNKLNEIPKTNN
jgi:hypothetical protein